MSKYFTVTFIYNPEAKRQGHLLNCNTPNISKARSVKLHVLLSIRSTVRDISSIYKKMTGIIMKRKGPPVF
jgi:hypothetical protein